MKKILTVVLCIIITVGAIAIADRGYRGSGTYPVNYDGTKYDDWADAFAAGQELREAQDYQQVWFNGYKVFQSTNTESNTDDRVIYYKEVK